MELQGYLSVLKDVQKFILGFLAGIILYYALFGQWHSVTIRPVSLEDIFLRMSERYYTGPVMLVADEWADMRYVLDMDTDLHYQTGQKIYYSFSRLFSFWLS